MDNKYQNGKIYKIWSLETDEIYVGSTCQPLHKRLHQHRVRSKREIYKNTKLYSAMTEFGVDAFKIELIDDYPCSDKNALTLREGYWIRELKALLNRYIAGRTQKERNAVNKPLYYSANIKNIFYNIIKNITVRTTN